MGQEHVCYPDLDVVKFPEQLEVFVLSVDHINHDIKAPVGHTAHPNCDRPSIVPPPSLLRWQSRMQHEIS